MSSLYDLIKDNCDYPAKKFEYKDHQVQAQRSYVSIDEFDVGYLAVYLDDIKVGGTRIIAKPAMSEVMDNKERQKLEEKLKNLKETENHCFIATAYDRMVALVDNAISNPKVSFN